MITTTTTPYLLNAKSYAEDKGEQYQPPNFGLGSVVLLAEQGWRVIRGTVVAINKDYSTCQILDVYSPFTFLKFQECNVFNVEDGI